MLLPRDTQRLLRRLERGLRGPVLLLPAALLSGACSSLAVAGSGANCCVEHEWTGPAEVAAAFASPGSTEHLGCSTIVNGAASPSRALPPDAGAPPGEDLQLLEEATRKRREAGDTESCVYQWASCCPGGRPLEVAGRRVVAEPTAGARWSKGPRGRVGLSLAPEARAAVSRAWFEDALAEHASVASFARATLELIAVGAPPRLLAAHQRAGIQEIAHAQRCFALARAYGGGDVDPGAIAVPAPRAAHLVRLACDTFAEGCVAETFGALLAERALAGCRVEAVRAALRVIAADEAAHAALAWKTLAWAARQGGPAVVRAVAAVAADLRTHAAFGLEIPGAANAMSAEPMPDLPAHGRLGGAAHRRCAEDAWTGIVEPLLASALGIDPS
jgi:hypothetical protein